MPAVAVRFCGSVIVRVQVPAPTDVTVTVEPLTFVVTMPPQPDATYGPVTPSVIVRVCGLAVVASNVSVVDESESGTGVGDAVGDAVGEGLGEGAGDGVGLGGAVGTVIGVVVTEPVQAANTSTRQAPSDGQRTVRSLLAIPSV